MATAQARKRRSGFENHPGYEVRFEVCAKRIRVLYGGVTVADSVAARLLHETRHTPVYYFPRADVRMDLMARTDHESFCPFKGDASYWTLATGGRVVENAVWSYEDPFPETAGIKDYVAFYWDRMDAWFEEDDEVLGHARDPYVRIDILNSSRPVRVTLGGETLAESGRARFVFETGLPVRYYIPPEDVQMELLEASETRSMCPYKGVASYFSARVGGKLREDVAWCYPDAFPECAAIEGWLCFYPDRVDTLTVDGEPAG